MVTYETILWRHTEPFTKLSRLQVDIGHVKVNCSKASWHGSPGMFRMVNKPRHRKQGLRTTPSRPFLLLPVQSRTVLLPHHLCTLEKRFTNTREARNKHLTPFAHRRGKIYKGPCKPRALSSNLHSKTPHRKTARSVSKSRPFLNAWAPSPSVQQYQFHASAKRRNMASATTFYDFKPIDSTYILQPQSCIRHSSGATDSPPPTFLDTS
jgi:hypothetical protein